MQQVFNLTANLGGMGFIAQNKALCMLSVLINTHMLQAARHHGVERFFYASSACVYNGDKQKDPRNPGLKEEDAYPALAEDGYGWEKLFSERMCRHFREDFGLVTRVARFHNVYGPLGTWDGGREKAPAAMCRKVAEADDGGVVEVWGDGTAMRSYTHVDDMIDAICRLMQSDLRGGVNIGCPQYVTVDELVATVAEVAGKKVRIKHVAGPVGVQSRNFSNARISSTGWQPRIFLKEGISLTYPWIEAQVQARMAQR